MIKTFISLTLVLGLLLQNIGTVRAQPVSQVLYPCSMVLHPLKHMGNAQGTALITMLKEPYSVRPDSPVRERVGIGIYAGWLPSPGSFGDYDQYEGFAQIPGQISWRFRLYQVKEDTPSLFGGSDWAGKWDEISPLILPAHTRLEVRLSNAKINKLGPAVLQNTVAGCHPNEDHN